MRPFSFGLYPSGLAMYQLFARTRRLRSDLIACMYRAWLRRTTSLLRTESPTNYCG